MGLILLSPHTVYLVLDQEFSFLPPLPITANAPPTNRITPPPIAATVIIGKPALFSAVASSDA